MTALNTSTGPSEESSSRQGRGARRAAAYSLVGALVFALVVGSGVWLVYSTVFVRTWRNPDAVSAPSESPTLRATVADLVAHGVVVRPPVRASLNELLNLWVIRPDLQKLFSTADGQPNLQSLFLWAAGTPDSSAIALLGDHENLDELAGRMGILPANGDPLAPLAWTLRNRSRPLYPADGIVGRLTEVWHTRADVRTRFSVDGRVDVKGLLFWGANISPSDASFRELDDVSGGMQRLLDELEGR